MGEVEERGGKDKGKKREGQREGKKEGERGKVGEKLKVKGGIKL